MKKICCFVTVLAIAALSAGNAMACDKHEQAKAKAGCSKSGIVAVGDKAAVGDEAAVADKAAGCHKFKSGFRKTLAAGEKYSGCHKFAQMPAIAYRVGDKETPCLKEAQSLAGKEGEIAYLLSDKSYDDRTEAVKALTAILNERTDELLTVRMRVGDKSFYCPMSAKQVAKDSGSQVRFVALARSFEEKADADKAVAQARETLKKVALTYNVDGAPTKCSMTASKCAKDGKKVEYVLGDESTCCPVEAQMFLARARLLALINAPKLEPEKQTASL